MAESLQIERFATRSLVNFLLGCVAILICEFAESRGLINDLQESILRAVVWAAVCGFAVYNSVVFSLPWGATAAVIVFSLCTVTGFAVGIIKDLPAMDDTPLIGSHGPGRHLFEKTLAAGWAASVAYLFYPLHRALAGRTRELSETVDKLNREISVRKQAEAELRSSEENYRQVFDVTSDGLLVLQHDGRVAEANRAACRLLGWNYQELIGTRLEPPFAPSNCDSQQLCSASYIKADGTPLDVELQQHNITYQNSPHTLRVIRDVTDRKLAEERERQRRDELAHVGRVTMMGEIASGLGHELNQPLAAISTFSDACLTHLSSGDNRQSTIAPLLEKVREQSMRAGAIVHRIRRLLRKERSESRAVRVDNLFDEVLTLMDGDFRRHDISVVTRLPERPPEVWGDEIQLQQVLLNLLRNSTEALSQSEPPAREIRLDVRNGETAYVEIDVCDTGPGMSEETRDKAFDAFYSTKPEGMGMGLAICRTIVQAHGGSICLARNGHEGVTCCIRWRKRARAS